VSAADPARPPDQPARLAAVSFPERVRLVCQVWASQVHATPLGVIALYWVKYLVLFAGGWAFFASFARGWPGLAAVGDWAFTGDAFRRAVLWAIVYESIGVGCSSGPMNGRFVPPIGGILYFLRPGTTKLPLVPGLPVLGGMRRTWLDVVLYAANLGFLLRALVAPAVTPALLAPSAVLIPLLGVTDKTLFLAARGEHYWVALVCLAAAGGGGPWIAACKLVWCAIWFWAATSKLNHHFPSVIMVMMNNGPFFPRWLKRRLFVAYPDDLRPSRLAVAMAHAGTAVEYLIPVVLLSSGTALQTGIGLAMAASFHGFIAANNPSGMPIEWNILMVYGAVVLFGVHADASVLAVGSMPLLVAFLAVWLVVIPAVGNVVPSRVSFLLAMRYYAGNWAYNIWLVRRDALAKLGRLTKLAGTMREQLERILPDREAVENALALSMAHRFMHLEGRPLLEALPEAARDIDAYEWIDGEVLGGIVLGWNFGDGHLNGRQLLDAVQAQCGFAEGEVRVVMVESQPLFGRTMAWQVVDAARGVLAKGETAIAPMRAAAPWPTAGQTGDYLASRAPCGPPEGGSRPGGGA
jgi:hypothetical protein